jgi:hypothetical protein
MRAFALFLLIVTLSALPVLAQEKKQDLLTRLPSALNQHAQALGDRVLAPGKERTVFTGQFVDEKGKTSTVRLTLQLPGLVLLEGHNPGGPPLKFDGQTRAFRSSRLEEELLETFTSDTPEGMLTSIKEGAAVHLLGRHVLPLEQDVFEVTGPVRSSATGLIRLKRYSFDSDTGLLASTAYADETYSPPMKIETRFSNWRQLEGSAYPGRIERLENGHTAFTLTINTITASPKQSTEER